MKEDVFIIEKPPYPEKLTVCELSAADIFHFTGSNEVHCSLNET